MSCLLTLCCDSLMYNVTAQLKGRTKRTPYMTLTRNQFNKLENEKCDGSEKVQIL